MRANPKEKDGRPGARRASSEGREEPLELSKAAGHLLEECRMVLPGIQALFGFQLIAVFSQGFSSLAEGLKALHLAATVLTAVAVALVMTPAAYQRLVSPMAVTEGFVRRSSLLLLAAMFPLAASLCAELYLVAYAVIAKAWVWAIAVAMLLLLLLLWIVLPLRLRRLQNDTM